METCSGDACSSQNNVEEPRFNLEGLEAFTIYQISVKSRNEVGESGTTSVNASTKRKSYTQYPDV